jgi:hypothetical protein
MRRGMARKTLLLVPFASIALFPRPALSQETQVFTDSHGVRTYTNIPEAQRTTPAPVKDKQGVETYTNVPPPRQPKPAPAKDKHGVWLWTNVPSSEVGNHRPARPTAEQAEGPDAASSGQWVYTSQYGWLWMPYGARFVRESSAAGATAHAFVYRPSRGWSWLAAPWVSGRGPRPFFGELGGERFSWYRY